MTDKLRAAAEAAINVLFRAGEELRWQSIGQAERDLRAALAEQDAEPVAWMDREGDLYKMPEIEGWAPPHTMLYTHPPRREWIGLTNEERKDIREHQELLEELGPVWAPMLLYYYLAIEAALKEKNA